jgi:hypothetical protein
MSYAEVYGEREFGVVMRCPRERALRQVNAPESAMRTRFGLMK